MEPGTNLPKAPEILPAPVESDPGTHMFEYPLKPEAYPATPEIARQPSQQMPIAVPQASQLNLSQASNPVTDDGTTPASPPDNTARADNAKTVEELKRAYINKAERIMAENASDPYTEAKLIEQTKVEYMKDIYKRQIKLPQD